MTDNVAISSVDIYLDNINVGSMSGTALKAIALLMQGSISDAAKNAVYAELDADAATAAPQWTGAKILSAALNLRLLIDGDPKNLRDQGIEVDFHWSSASGSGSRRMSWELMRAVIANDLQAFSAEAMKINLPLDRVDEVLAAASALLNTAIPVPTVPTVPEAMAMPPTVAPDPAPAADAAEQAMATGADIEAVEQPIIDAAAADPAIPMDVVVEMQAAADDANPDSAKPDMALIAS